MSQLLRKTWNKAKYLVISLLIITSVFLLTVVYKADEKIIKKSENTQGLSLSPDLKTFKSFVLRQLSLIHI